MSGRCRSESSVKSRGLSTLGWLLMFPVALLVLLILAIGFYEARKAYWDYKVREMCEKDGGVTVYERVMLSGKDYKRLGGIQEGLAIPNELDAKSDYPYFRKVIDTKIRDWNPEVMRAETLVVRRSDGKLLGRSVQYWRRGGDFPTGISEASSFICPQQSALSKQIFKVEEQPK